LRESNTGHAQGKPTSARLFRNPDSFRQALKSTKYTGR
jgi:hypothetical protein